MPGSARALREGICPAKAFLDHPALHSPSFSLCSSPSLSHSHLPVGAARSPRTHGPTSLHEPPAQLILHLRLSHTSRFSYRRSCFTTAPICSIRAQALHVPPSCHTPITTGKCFHTSLSPPNAQRHMACPYVPLQPSCQNTRALHHPQDHQPTPRHSALPASPALTHPLHKHTFSDSSLGFPPHANTVWPLHPHATKSPPCLQTPTAALTHPGCTHPHPAASRIKHSGTLPCKRSCSP